MALAVRSVSVIAATWVLIWPTAVMAVDKTALNAVASTPATATRSVAAWVCIVARSVALLKSKASPAVALLATTETKDEKAALEAASAAAPLPWAAADIAFTVVMTWVATFSNAKALSASTPEA